MPSWADAAELEAALEGAGVVEASDSSLATSPPPGFAPADAGKFDAAAIEAAATAAAGEAPPPSSEVDAPDLSLGKAPELVEEEGEEVRAEVSGEDSIYKAAETFEDLGLSNELLTGLYSGMNFKAPSKIQAKTLPLILTPPYRNIIAQGHNGSGKTTCFTLSMLSRVDPGQAAPQALCICPTRELAIQNHKVLQQMAQYTSITSKCTATQEYGDGGRGAGVAKAGASITEHVIIGTPGSLKNWITMGRKPPLDVTHMKILVFDEADQMLDETQSFKDISLRIIKAIEDKKKKSNTDPAQVLLFSATFSDVVKEFATRVVGPNAHRVFLPAAKLSLDVIKQYRVVCPREEVRPARRAGRRRHQTLYTHATTTHAHARTRTRWRF